MKNSNILIIGIFLAAAAITITTTVYVTDFKFPETPRPEPQVIPEEKPVEQPVIIVKQLHPILGEPYPTSLSDKYLAKWKKCLTDDTHIIQKVYPAICYASDGITARGPLQ